MDFLKYEKLIAASVDKLEQSKIDFKMLNLPEIDGWLQYCAKYIVSGLTIKDLKLMQEPPFGKNAAEFDLESKAPKLDEIKSGVSKIINSFTDNLAYSLSNGLSLVLFGFNGAGKTHTAKYLLYKVIDANYSGYYLSSSEFQRLYNKVNFSGEEDFNLRNVYNHMLNCDFLVIDEVGKESATDNFLVAFEEVLKYRASRNKSTCMITNLNFDNAGKNEFFARYGSSIYNLLYEHYRVILLSSKGEFRKKQRKEWK